MGRTRGGAGQALRAAALASVLLAACCPVPAGPPGVAAGASATATGAEARLTVRTSAGPVAEGGRLAHTEGGDVVRLVPEGAVALPADVTLYVAGRWAADGTLRVTSATPLDAAASAR